MSDKTPTIDLNGAVSMASALIATLRAEREALERLTMHFDEQIEAIRNRLPEALDLATELANDEVNALASLRQTRERQMRLLGRVLHADTDTVTLHQLADLLARTAGASTVGFDLLDARAHVRDQAHATRVRCEELEFALQYAARLGRELVHALHGLDAAAPTRVYTARGNAALATAPRPFVNRVG
jgi:hypothetical protein